MNDLVDVTQMIVEEMFDILTSEHKIVQLRKLALETETDIDEVIDNIKAFLLDINDKEYDADMLDMYCIHDYTNLTSHQKEEVINFLSDCFMDLYVAIESKAISKYMGDLI